MTTWIVSDTHFWHEALLHLWVYSRPVGYEKQIKIWLSRIKKEDTLIHLWDICIWNDEEHHKNYIQPLLCKKILVRWNHDKKSKTRYLNHWRDWVVDEYIINMKNKRILLTHAPLIDIWEWMYNIHWHYHDRAISPISKFHRLYSPERQFYKPIEIEKLIE